MALTSQSIQTMGFLGYLFNSGEVSVVCFDPAGEEEDCAIVKVEKGLASNERYGVDFWLVSKSDDLLNFDDDDDDKQPGIFVEKLLAVM